MSEESKNLIGGTSIEVRGGISEESLAAVKRHVDAMAERLRVVVYAAGMPFDAQTVATKSLGGSESAAYYLARELSRAGHAVVVFTSHPEPKSGDGVTYLHHGPTTKQAPLGDAFEHYATNTPHDLLVAQRHPHAFHRQFQAKVCVWQLHDLALHRSANAVLGGSWQIDAVTCVSQWHADQVRKVWNINPEVLRVVPNGVDAALYAAGPTMDVLLDSDGPFGKFNKTRADGACSHNFVRAPAGKFLLLYQSRPERGLNNALDVMEKAALIGLPVHLLACAYDNPVAHMEPMYRDVYARAAKMKNVTLLGALTKPELAALQRRCDLLLYPTEFEEVSCITAMEAMAAGLPMLTSAVGALPETCEKSGTMLVPLKDGRADLHAFDYRLQDLFGLVRPGEYPDALNIDRALQLEAAGRYTWRAAADRLLNVFREARAKKQASPAAVLRHCVEHSDIAFAEWYLDKLDNDNVDQAYSTAIGWDSNDAPIGTTAETANRWVNEELDRIHGPIIARTRDEIDRLYSFARDPAKYAAHYAKHQGAYYDGPGAHAAGEDVTGTLRYMGVWQMVEEHVRRTKADYLRVLDYGCAHGHYTMPLAKVFSGYDFVGMDISHRAVEQAQKWAERDGVVNAKFLVGSQADLAVGQGPVGADEVGTFDVIVAGEVLEHVWDYKALLDLLRGRLNPGGCLIVTTPLGRWEHAGTEAFRQAREHLHHFERGDIEDICAGHDSKIVHAPAGHDRSGFQLSSYVWAVWPKDRLPLWSVNYDRKLRQLAPRQTLSACMIVKDGEKSLRRCVESFVDWVDEVVIAVDPTTTDRTHDVIAGLVADFPNRPIRTVAGVDASREGFSAARNASIETAAGDWIMWVDADEEVRTPWNLHRFLRPSMHNGYGWPQVHYAVDPEQVLTTDYPCRLFRNRMGIRFYGYVHEHPELKLGDAVPWSLVRHEVKFLHGGYADEETRQRRFARNLPLLMRDREAYPTERPLNKFLMLRDYAQSIQFEAQSQGGTLYPKQVDAARRGIALMEEIMEMPQIKMIADSMQYYSLCVSSLGIGFDAELTMKTRDDRAPDLAASLNFNGRFHSRAFFERCVSKFTSEGIKFYEDPHL